MRSSQREQIEKSSKNDLQKNEGLKNAKKNRCSMNNDRDKINKLENKIFQKEGLLKDWL